VMTEMVAGEGQERADLDTWSVSAMSLRPPMVRETWIDRPRLLQRLDEMVDSPLLLVAAPAGYGKTTLVTQWAAGRDPATVAWVRLERADNDDPARLWSRLVAASQLVGFSIDGDVAEFPATSRLLDKTGTGLAGGEREVSIVVEDCHVLRSAAACELLSRFLDVLPPVVQVVMLSRSDPGLRLARRRVEGQLAEIRAAELAFTLAETATVLAVSNITLSQDALQELVRLTEGWPAAVALTALSLVDRPGPSAAEEFVHRLSGSDRFIADYLSEEVLGCQEQDLREFIVDMSVFDRFNTGLANEAAQISSAAGLLHRLERNNLFLIPQQEEGWYRFHHLFAAYGQATLEMEHPERVADLQRRGARWFASHDHPEDAIRHLLAAGDTDEAAQLIQRHWMRHVDAGRSATVTGWLQALRGTPADHGSAATLTAAWMAAWTGDPAELGRRLAALETMTTPTTLPDGTTSPRSGLLMIRGLIGSDGPDRMLIDAQDALALENNPASPWHAVARTVLGQAAFVTGDRRLARHHLTAATAAPLAPRALRILSYAVLSLCEAEQGDLATSRRHARQAMRLVSDHAMQQTHPTVLPAYTAHGVVLAAQGRLPEAMATLESGLDASRRAPGLSPWALIHHLIVMAGLTARMGDPKDRTDLLLAEVDTLTPWTDASMAATRTRIAAARNHLPDSTTGRLAVAPVVGESLTAREREILYRLQGHQTLREIAGDLWVSYNTVKTITCSVYRKLGAHSRSEAVTIARQQHASTTTTDRHPSTGPSRLRPER
jgi:LuxR family maltose regulon positive regulatory protein